MAEAIVANFFLEKVGKVTLTLRSDGLSWEPTDHPPKPQLGQSNFLAFKPRPAFSSNIKLHNTYSAEFIGNRPPNGSSARKLLINEELFWFTLRFAHRSPRNSNELVPCAYSFGHIDSLICRSWVDQIQASIEVQKDRPKNVLVFVNPRSGNMKGLKAWQLVTPIFAQSKVKAKVIVTERAGHAFDVISSCSSDELNAYDGFICVGGDGFFNEILNGFLLPRHEPKYPPSSFNNIEEDNDSERFSYEKFRFGIIPAGSTDALAMCTTGTRDPATCALLIVLGARVRTDIAQIIRWKETSSSETQPCVRYAASFAGYGFYGDVISESEKHRWMGPKRYDFAGTKVFMEHRCYEAEVTFLEAETKRGNVCRANCDVCGNAETRAGGHLRKRREKFISVGAAIISNRNDRSPDGLVADAHLCDGFLHLLLIRECSRPQYLWHLTQLAKRGGEPLKFEFVEHYKTSAFTFSSIGKESIWNIDGELFPAHCLSARIFRGLINIFASGPQI